MTPNCKNCAFYRPAEEKTFVLDYGRCSRFPPVVMADADGLPSSEWPGVSDEEHCGEWKASQ